MPALIDYLTQLQTKGRTHVALDPGARTVLRELYKKARQPAASSAPAPVSASSLAAPAAQASVQAATPQPAKPSPPPAPLQQISLVPTSGPAQARLESLKDQLSRFPQTDSFRSTLVFSTGHAEADIMIVGDAPGFDDERHQAPFSGPAGEKLDGILKAMGLDRATVYLTCAIKYRPAMANQSTGNRKPTSDEVARFIPFLREEVAIIQPKVIIALGATAAEALLGQKLSISAARGEWHEFEKTPVRASYHPSFLLHSAKSLSDKRAVWEDMLSVMEKLELPISDKQQGHFLPKKSS